jgi:predicted unusual protein kinase regulating ubiquinone biosynthesis (AarF/ABC1/UbiB family)
VVTRVASTAPPAMEETDLGDFPEVKASVSSMGVGDGVVDVTDAQRKALRRSKAVKEYNPERAAKYYNKRPLEQLARVAQISSALGGFVVDVAMDTQRGDLEKNAKKRADQLRSKLTALGPAFVKVGQALSTRPDLLPAQYLDELTSLQDALPTFADADAFDCVEEELGRPLEEMFGMITPSPIAAASLGQVYRATLKDSGKEVALKVQRPNIPDGLELDFHLIREGAKFADRFVDSLNTSIVDLVDEFAARVFQELNYVQEGINAERFARLYGDRPDVVVPGIEWEYTSPKVITMDWIQGTKLSDQESLRNQGLDVLQLVDTGIQCSLRQLLEYGYFHADPHPGNLLATPEGKLAFLDFGMMSETPERARYAIIEHVVHLVNRDYEAMARDYYALEFLDPSVDVTPIVPALAAFFDDVLDASVEELNFKTITDGLGSVLYAYPFNVPGYYALILRSLTVLEGLALSTDPKFKVLGKAYPYMARRLLTDPRPQLRDAFSELLFKDGKFRWNRLENLLREGSKSDDYNGSDVIPPLIELIVGEDKPGENNELRPLVEREAILVVEALLLGQSLETARSEQFAPLVNLLPEQLKRLPPIQVGSQEEEARMMELRTQVLRVTEMLSSSKGFDPTSLQPLTEALRKPAARRFVETVVSGVAQRVTARFLRELLGQETVKGSGAAASTAR